MSAHADDLRYFYGEEIGRTVQVTGVVGASTPLSEALTPGRYVVRILAFGGGTAVWVRQGAFGDVVAAAVEPSMQFLAHTSAPDLNLPVMTFMVRPAPKGDSADVVASDGLAFHTVGGANSTIQITKVSRGKQ